MKKGKYLFAVIFAACLLPVSAQMPVEEIIANHIEARGGAKWQKVHSLKMTGAFTGFSITKPFTLYRSRPNKLYFDHYLGDKKMLIAYDGQQLWWVNPWMNISNAERIKPGPDHKVWIRETDFTTPFFDYKAQGFKVEYLGLEEYEGLRGHKIKLIRSDDHEETWYIDPDTYLEQARIAPGSDFGSPFPAQVTFYDDFREVEGLKIPFVMDTSWHTRSRVLEVEKIEINAEVEETLFVKPLPPFVAPLIPIVGEWKVNTRMMFSPGGDWREIPGESTVTLRNESRLFVQEALVPGFNGPMGVYRTLSYNEDSQTYTLTSYDDMSKYTNILVGTLEAGALTFDNLKTDTSWKAFGRTLHEKIVIKDISADSFTIETSNTADGGKKWWHYRSSTYTKAGDK